MPVKHAGRVAGAPLPVLSSRPDQVTEKTATLAIFDNSGRPVAHDGRGVFRAHS